MEGTSIVGFTCKIGLESSVIEWSLGFRVEIDAVEALKARLVDVRRG